MRVEMRKVTMTVKMMAMTRMTKAKNLPMMILNLEAKVAVVVIAIAEVIAIVRKKKTMKTIQRSDLGRLIWLDVLLSPSLNASSRL